jgi:GAF domain-containing protein
MVEIGALGVVDRVLGELTHRALASDDPALFGLVDVARRASAEVTERSRELGVIAAAVATIAVSADLDASLTALLDGVAALTGAEAGSVCLIAPVDSCRVFRWRRGGDRLWDPDEAAVGTAALRVLASGRAEYFADLPSNVEFGQISGAALRGDGIRSTLVVALDVAGRVIGTLHAESFRPRAFDRRMLAPMQTLADHAAGALEQARLRGPTKATARLDALKTARIVGHELNNMLTIVSGYGDLLVDRMGPSEHAPTIQRMIDASDEAALMLRRLQSIIRLEERSHDGVAVPDTDPATP